VKREEVSMELLALLFVGSCGVFSWKNTSPPPFTQEEINKTLELRSISEYNDYCKSAATKGLFSDRQLTYQKYFAAVKEGFVRSTNRHGKSCWYNRNTDVELGLVGLTSEFN